MATTDSEQQSNLAEAVSGESVAPSVAGDPTFGRRPVTARWRPGIGGAVGPASLALCVVLLALAVALPFVLSGYWVRVLTSVFMFAALSQSLNVIAGMAGYADFGNIVYFGIGAYGSAFLMNDGVPIPLAIVGGAVLCAVMALILGLPILRLRGHYFAIATIGIVEGTRELVNNMGFVGGGSGLNLPLLRMPPAQFAGLIYFLMLGLAVVYTIGMYALSRSSLGYSLRAIKADEQAAAVMGINTTRAKATAWSISAAATGVLGGIYALWVGFIQTSVVFDTVTGTKYFMMVLLGGPGTVLGPVVGGFLLELLDVTVWSQFQTGHLAILGVVIALVVLFLPSGLVPTLRGRSWRPFEGHRARARPAQ